MKKVLSIILSVILSVLLIAAVVPSVAAVGDTYSLNVGDTFTLIVATNYSRYAISSTWSANNNCIQFTHKGITTCEIKATAYTSRTVRVTCVYTYSAPTSFNETLTDTYDFYINIKNTGGDNGGNGGDNGGNGGDNGENGGNGGNGGVTECILTLDPNGGEIGESVSPISIIIISGSAVGNLPTPSRSGYIFDGWYTQRNGGSSVTSSEVFSSSTTIYAHWKSPQYISIRLDPNGGTVSSNVITITSGNAIGYLPTPSRSGYIFDGWYTQRDGGSVVTSSEVFSSSTTIYAHWKQIISSVTVSGVTPPKVGASPVFSASVEKIAEYTVSAINSGNIKNGVAWYDVSAKKFMTTNDKYVKGNEYRLYVYIKPKESYAFFTNPKASINCIPANPFLSQSDNSIYLVCTFREKDVWNGTIADSFDSGSGWSSDPYVIKTASQLAYLAKQCSNGNTYEGKYFSLAADIDLNNIEWTPIDNFHGRFNGTGHIIYNLTINNTALIPVGLFGSLSNATIERLGINLADINIVRQNFIHGGLLCGSANKSTISKCFAKGNVYVSDTSEESNDNAYVGILVGSATETTISDCYAYGSVYSAMPSSISGGLIGLCRGSNINNCYFIGEIRANGCKKSSAGGLLGFIDSLDYNDTKKTKISNSFVRASKVFAENGQKASGTIVPNNSYGSYSISNCYYEINKMEGNPVCNGNILYNSSINSQLGWDSNNIWNLRDNGNPTLRVFNLLDDKNNKTIWRTEKEPTCTESGVKKLYCTDCGAVLDTEEIPAKGHTVVIDAAKHVTCTESGLTEGSHCSVCHTVLVPQEVIQPEGHQWDEGEIIKQPTCTTTGEKVYHCKNCEHTKTETLSALGHNFSNEYTVDKAATCNQDGLKSRHCSRCEAHTDEVVIDKNGHDWDNGKVTKQPTCIATGEKIYHCKNCEETRTETVSALGHNFSNEYTVDKEPTCTENGSKSRHCSRCDASTDETIIEKHGHDWNDGTVTKQPTCTTTGEKVYICKNCEQTKTETLYALGHEYSDEFIIDKKATCTEDGSKSRHCTRCEAHTDEIVIEKHGHHTELVSNHAATYFTKGYTGDKKCTVCGKVVSKGKAIAKLKLATPKVKITAGKQKLTVKYTKVKDATGFQVKYTYKGKTKTKNYTSKKSVKKIIKKLKKGSYKVKVRAMIKLKGKTAYSKWTKVKKVKVK